MTVCPECGHDAVNDRPQPLLLDLNEAAEMLGVSRRTVERLRHGGHLPATCIGGRAVVRPADLTDYVARLSADPLTDEAA